MISGEASCVPALETKTLSARTSTVIPDENSRRSPPIKTVSSTPTETRRNLIPWGFQEELIRCRQRWRCTPYALTSILAPLPPRGLEVEIVPSGLRPEFTVKADAPGVDGKIFVARWRQYSLGCFRHESLPV